jgi:hypothetical protein
MRQQSKTTAQTVLLILSDTGYCSSAAEMGRLLRIEPKNIHRYLQPSGSQWRIAPRIETLAQWCWAITQTTGLSLRVLIDSSGEVDIEVSGYDAHGKAIQTTLHNTSYREHDQYPLQHWQAEWAEFLEHFSEYYVEKSTSS